MLFNNVVYLGVTEVDLIAHVEKGALSELEVVHSLRALSRQDDDSESVWEGPRDPIGRLFGFYALIVFVISEIFKAIKDHNDSATSISGASTITLSLRVVASSAGTH